ncbi:MAG: anhydro-N-acetylmuramic acid kinase [Proteobacteria bacterium]|nr:anhydro-N-acetylmuramic acid kinase [Pseudomonadota bacterium]
MKSQLYKAIGLMSGTSLDGVDVCLVETDGGNKVRMLGHFYRKYGKQLRQRLSDLAQGDLPLNDVLRLERALSLDYAKAVLDSGFLKKHKVAVVGCHGQTLRHLPKEGLTWQLGDMNLLAEKVGVPVVGDFRRRDMAAGGEGAPLAPLFHQVMMKGRKRPWAVLNIGGVANVTLCEADGEVWASDCGPGMGLLDQWVQMKKGMAYDKDGKLAAKGTADMALVARALAEVPFWRKRVPRKVPRSADRYEFSKVLDWLDGAPVAHGAATLAALTVAGIHRTLQDLEAKPGQLEGVFVVGGGGLHPVVMDGLRAKGWAVREGRELGWAPTAVEAACFAWLAVRRLRGLTTTLPSTTGCARPTVGGVLTA